MKLLSNGLKLEMGISNFNRKKSSFQYVPESLRGLVRERVSKEISRNHF